ncbi:hypothetical protein [Brevundimonas sp. TWP2-3-4b1]|uniref:hypothetical protein n=1 Tax=Brevundimonas sp. TWP2-3-4b1 TaxID=2804580 RepID=UPI003CEB5702
MTRLDDEILMRRVDGELGPTEAAAVDAAAEADPTIAAWIAALRQTRTAAAGAFPAATDARDRDLARLIAASRRASPFESIGRALAEALAPRRAVIWGGLATAAFVGGLALGPLLGGRSEGLRVEGGALADAGLVRVLDTRLNADGADGAGRSVGLTFRDGEGRWCRTFQAAEAGVAGLACRRDDGWAMQVLAPMAPSSGDIRMAGSDTPEAVLDVVDATIAGETLGAADEAQARNGGWRQRSAGVSRQP